MNQSGLLQSKIVEAHEELWRKVVEVRSGLPAPYGTVLGLWFSILSIQELVDLREKRDFQFSAKNAEFINLATNYSVELIRPYVREHLWRMARGRIRFAFRLLVLFSSDTPAKSELIHWPEDGLVVQNLRTAFSEQELERFNYSDPAAFQEISDLWDTRIIAEIHKALLD